MKLVSAANPPAHIPTATAFTLMEIPVAVAIVSVLAALLAPMFSSVGAKGDEVKCLSNLWQIASATQGSGILQKERVAELNQASRGQ